VEDRQDRIDKMSPVLLWRQVADDIRADISTGKLAPGARLPGELDLADAYDVSRDTIRRAIAELASEGLLVTLHGRGTIVRPS